MFHGDRFNDTGKTMTVLGTPVTGVTNVEPREKDWVLGVQHVIAPNLKLIGEYRDHNFEDRVGGGKLKDDGFTMRFMIGF